MVDAKPSKRGKAAIQSPLAPDFGPWLRRARESLHMTVKEFAERADLSTSTVTNFESGSRMAGAIAVELFVRFSRALNMDLGYVLYKAGFDIGPDGVNLSKLRRVEMVAEDFAKHEWPLRFALAEAIGEFDRRGDDRMILELSRGLAALDRMSERLRREGFTPGRAVRDHHSGGENGRIWNLSERTFLQEHLELSDEEIAGHLGRTVYAVRAQRKRIGGDA